MTTYNQIDVALNRIATAHKQINSYGHGDLWEIASSGTINYPMMWVVDKPANISNGAMSYNFSVLIMDRVDKGERIEKEVLSDTFLMASDVLVELGHPDWPFAFNIFNSNPEPFTERFDDEVAGWAFDISLKVPFTGSSCDTPFDTINRVL